MRTSAQMIKVQEKIAKFDGKPIKENRKELYQTIQELVSKYDFIRKDKNKTVELKLHSEPSLNADIIIGVDNSNNIWICDDSFWRTIEGVYEHEQELRAYSRESF